MIIPYVDLKIQNNKLHLEIQSALQHLIETSAFVLGPATSDFEKKFAKYNGVEYAIGVSNGTSALQIALMALGLHSGDEVIVPAMTFFATAEAVAAIGARPVFADIDPKSFTLDTEKVESCITSRTRVILPVHLYGHPADMDALLRIANSRNIKVVEDCAHAHGACYKGKRVGGFGALGAFSFYPSKNLGALGEAGAIVTDDPDLAHLCRSYRDHGSTEKFVHQHVGLNARIDGLQSAILSVKLPYLDEWNENRRCLARLYADLLSNAPIELPSITSYVEHVFHVFQVQTKKRDEVFQRMLEEGIGVNIHYPVPMHLHPGFAYLGYVRGDFPIAERLAEESLSLPCYPEMTGEQVELVVNILRSTLKSVGV